MFPSFFRLSELSTLPFIPHLAHTPTSTPSNHPIVNHHQPFPTINSPTAGLPQSAAHPSVPASGGPAVAAMAKETLDSDRVNYMIWRYVFPREPLARNVRYRQDCLFANRPLLLHRYLIESGTCATHLPRPGCVFLRSGVLTRRLQVMKSLPFDFKRSGTIRIRSNSHVRPMSRIMH